MSPKEIVKRLDLSLLVPALANATDESFGLAGFTQVFYSKPDLDGNTEVIEVAVDDDGEQFIMLLGRGPIRGGLGDTQKVAKINLIQQSTGRWTLDVHNYLEPEVSVEEAVFAFVDESAVMTERRAG